MKLLRAIRQEVRGGEGRKHYHISESELEELDQLLDAAGEETDIIRRLRKGLAKTQLNLVGSIERLLSGRSEIDDDLLDELSDVLLLADLGVDTTTRVLDAIRARVDSRELRDPMKIKRLIRDQIEELLSRHTGGLNVTGAAPYVIMMVGVNGVGKTTTIAKLAKRLKDEGKQVLLAAGDTFRAGAIEQLEVWGERVACEVIKQSAGSDPSAVAYDAVTAAEARHAECLIVDTAGRLHTKVNLMEELKKVRRVIDKKLPGAPHEILLVVDATTGQNAVNQAKLFHEAVGVTGVVLTKMDGTAKGGIIVRIVNELNIPVKFIGIGEGMDDLRPFDPADFVTALFG
ncbi:signal recognition particle-docking protein FtsY [bacterium]|nr:signal recognition particle-docking protein FtsY [candidate division CSSED10-310 bacterium]